MATRRRAFPAVICAVAWGIASPAPASAGSARAQEAISFGACAHIAARGQAWLEMTLWGLHDQEGGWAGASVPNLNGSFDLGPMQVNSQWAPVIASRLRRSSGEVARWLQNDICFNVQVATWIFLDNYRAARDYWRAVGLYHSPVARRQSGYIRSVAARLARRFGRGVFADRARPGGVGAEVKLTQAPFEI